IYSCGTGLSKPEETQECEAGPGDEPTDRTLVVNVFKEPLPFMNESTFKEKGYVIVRYFWSDTCPPCFSPVNIESELEILAGEFKDLMVLSIIDVDEYKQEASKYAKIGGFVYTPFIRVEGDGKHGYVNWFGNNLRDKLSDLKYETAQEVCRRTDLCHYDDSGKLHKDF
ncbi:MAG: thioredoxin family protein, partial [Candidatus Altiarchaeota archaeon]|nr:thioredoxin family protein [Candidatus Altiarchaeota archaeon]